MKTQKSLLLPCVLITSHYRGELSGDSIKGKWNSDWSGEVVTRDREAKRSKE